MAIKFILNNTDIHTTRSSGETLLDFIRYHQHLTGTKIGCREGDCGACTILIGEVVDHKSVYETMTSCITPLGNASGKHVVTIEGLNMDQLSPIQKSMVEYSGSQCGFCTPGFIVSMTSCAMSTDVVSPASFEQVIDGNICRCTGYTPMQRVGIFMAEELKTKDVKNPISWAVQNNYLPTYFTSITDRLIKIINSPQKINTVKQLVGGGTDLYVQRHDDMPDAEIDLVFNDRSLQGIKVEHNVCTLGGGTTASQLLKSKELNDIFPNLKAHLLLVSSTPIRNMGTIAGNFVNASPIGDLTAFFLALNSQINLRSQTSDRTIYLKDFYKGYKDIDMATDEIIHSVLFDIPSADSFFNFEKISKRTYLDIASVNSGLLITIQKNRISDLHITAGGVGPTPKYLSATRKYMIGQALSAKTIVSAISEIQKEISPISDARGSEKYKRLALRQLFYGHFIELFPTLFTMKNLVCDNDNN